MRYKVRCLYFAQNVKIKNFMLDALRFYFYTFRHFSLWCIKIPKSAKISTAQDKAKKGQVFIDIWKYEHLATETFIYNFNQTKFRDFNISRYLSEVG